jgi:hypothetical protein
MKNKANFLLLTQFPSGLCAVAGFLKDATFISQQMMDSYDKSTFLSTISKDMLSFNNKTTIKPLYHNIFSQALPDEMCTIKPMDDRVISLPILLVIDRGRGSEILLAEILRKGELLVYDSYNKTVDVTTLDIFVGGKSKNKFLGLYGFFDGGSLSVVKK